MRKTPLGIVALSIVLWSAQLMASEPPEAEPPDHGYHNTAALRTIGLLEVKQDKRALFFGPGALIERTLIDRLLEVEISAAFLMGHGVTMPIDLLLKFPVEINDKFTVYLGGGGAITFILPEEGEKEVHPGTIVSLGTYVWLWHEWGLNFEVDYATLFEAEHVAHEFETAVGVVYRF
jgi:hypothetical protein